jgi:hypothetical protein
MIWIDVHPAWKNSTNMTRTLPTPVHVRSMYASCGQSSYVATFHESSTELDRVTAPEKKGSWHNLQHAGWPIHGFVPSFSPKPTNEAVEKAKTSINSRLLGLPDPYHRHMIGTFNTCSWRPTERFLIDTDDDYNLRGAGLSRTHSSTFPTSCPHFFLVAPPGLHLTQF